MRVGIDLLWVRPGKCGGTESFIRNLMTGFAGFDQENEYVLFAAKDNAGSFAGYKEYRNMHLKVCPVNCSSQPERILWENLHLDRYAVKENVDIMFIPVYSKPRSKKGGIPYVTVIHDLQALHYPQYFSFVKRLFLRYSWRHTCRTSACVVTISDYCRKDIQEKYFVPNENIRTVYNPICSEESDNSAVDTVLYKFGVAAGQYDYCVSSLLPHKNLLTILKTIAERKKRGIEETLVLSGVGGDSEEFLRWTKELDIEKNVIQTGYISNAERDCLYKGCRLFLFPSVFEGFGMPPIEAMRFGKRVVMTKESCLFEVTDGKAVYVEDPYSVEEWMKKIDEAKDMPEKKETFPQYELAHISEQYVHIFKQIIKAGTR